MKLTAIHIVIQFYHFNRYLLEIIKLFDVVHCFSFCTRFMFRNGVTNPTIKILASSELSHVKTAVSWCDWIILLVLLASFRRAALWSGLHLSTKSGVPGRWREIRRRTWSPQSINRLVRWSVSPSHLQNAYATGTNGSASSVHPAA